MLLSLISRGLPKIKTFSTMACPHIKVAANDFLDFVNASPTPFHAVKSVKERLSKAGFKEIKVSLLLQSHTPCSSDLTFCRRKNHGHPHASLVVNTSSPETALRL
jgi:aspartyl aminopeptidase